MKKIIAIILCMLCLASCLTVPGYAAASDVLGDIVDDYLGVTEEEDIGDQLTYGIHYEMQPLSTVALMYKPSATITFTAPTMAKITTDTPLSVDYNFVCWKHSETGKYYYPGDTIEVTGVVTLYAVFEPKTDNYSQFIRYILTGLECLKRVFRNFLIFNNALEDTDSEYYPVETTTAVA